MLDVDRAIIRADKVCIICLLINIIIKNDDEKDRYDHFEDVAGVSRISLVTTRKRKYTVPQLLTPSLSKRHGMFCYFDAFLGEMMGIQKIFFFFWGGGGFFKELVPVNNISEYFKKMMNNP